MLTLMLLTKLAKGFFLLITAVGEAIEAIVGIQIGDAENPKVD